MSGFEIAGIALAGPAVVQLLIKVSVEGYKLFQDTKLVGKEYQQLKHELDIQQERYLDWLRSLSACGGDLSNIVDPKSRRYELVLTTLAMIAGVFAEVDQLNRKYGITQIDPEESAKVIVLAEEETEVKSQKQGFRKYLNIGKSVFSRHQRDKSKDARPQLAPRQSTGHSQNTIPEDLESTQTDFSLMLKQELLPSDTEYRVGDLEDHLKSLQENDLTVQVPGLERRATELATAAEKYQQALPTYRKYQWKFSSKEQLQRFVEDLAKYVTYLEVLTNSQLKKQNAIAAPVYFREFDVPINPPFPQLLTFCGREDILDDMVKTFKPADTEASSRNRQTIVLHGMGGLGKSQIALEYTYRYARYYSATLWIDATDWTTINNSCSQIVAAIIAHYAAKYISKPEHMSAGIAIDLKIPGQIDNTGQLIGDAQDSPWKVVRNWLARRENSRWLLIADGLNDEEDSERLQEVLPVGSHGHIVITSRVTLTSCTILDIPVMDRDSGVRLLLGNKFETASEKVKETVEKIVDILGNLPLALAQAVAYIEMRRLDFERYLERLSKDLWRLVGQVTPGYKNGVFSGWRLSVEALKKYHPDCVPLLRLCSFLSPHGVSEELLSRGIGVMDWLQNDKSRLEDAIDHLVKYGLAKRITEISPASRTIQLIWIHHLVQHWARNAIHNDKLIIAENNQERLHTLHKNGAKDAVRLVGWGMKADFEGMGVSEFIYQRENWPHIKLCCDDYIPRYKFEDDEIVDGKLGRAMRQLGTAQGYWHGHKASLALFKKAIKILELASVKDPSWEEELLTAKVADVQKYIFGNAYDPSIDVHGYINDIIRRQEGLFGENDHATLASWALLGSYLNSIGRTIEARDLLLKQLERMEAVMEKNDHIYIVALDHLASVYIELNEHETALKIYIQAYELEKEKNGMNTKSGIIGLRNLGKCKELMDDLEGACECYEGVAKAAEATYGLANKDTVRSLRLLYNMYLRLGRENDAHQLEEKIHEATSLLL